MSDRQFSSSRRDVMKALGAGTALSALGGVTVVGASQDQEGDGGQEGNGSGQEGDGQTGAGTMGTVYQVQTLIGPPSIPDRPADFFFQPTGLHVQPGDVLQFVFTTPDHNVVSYHPVFGMQRRVPIGVDSFSSPLKGLRPSSVSGDQVEPPVEISEEGVERAGQAEGGPVPDTFLLAFETPGVYDILCSPHEHFGMNMRVVVGDETQTRFETSNPENLPVPRAGPVGLARVTLTDPALQPAAIVEQGSVLWQDLESVQAPPDGAGNGPGGPGNETTTPGNGTTTPGDETTTSGNETNGGAGSEPYLGW